MTNSTPTHRHPSYRPIQTWLLWNIQSEGQSGRLGGVAPLPPEHGPHLQVHGASAGGPHPPVRPTHSR